MPFNLHLISTPWEPARAGRAGRGVRGRAARGRAGRTGCSATTTAAASRAGSGRRRRGWRRCCCSRCAGRRRSTTATSSGWRTCRSRPSACRTRTSSTRPGSASGATRRARRCRGRRAPNAGFCPPDVEPWLPFGDVPSVDAQRDDPRSMLSLYRALLALRRGAAAAATAPCSPTTRSSPTCAATCSSRSTCPASRRRSRSARSPGRVRLSTHLDGRADEVRGELPLRADEGVVICLCNA